MERVRRHDFQCQVTKKSCFDFLSWNNHNGADKVTVLEEVHTCPWREGDAIQAPAAPASCSFSFSCHSTTIVQETLGQKHRVTPSQTPDPQKRWQVKDNHCYFKSLHFQVISDTVNNLNRSQRHTESWWHFCKIRSLALMSIGSLTCESHEYTCQVPTLF